MFPVQNLSTLVVDDNPDVVDFLAHVLKGANCEVRSAVNGDQALQQANACNPDIVFLDIRIPEQDGWLVCSKLKMQSKAPRVILITGQAKHDTDRFADFVQADKLLKKPFSESDVLQVMKGI